MRRLSLGLAVVCAAALAPITVFAGAPPVDQGPGAGYEALVSLTKKAQSALDAGNAADAAKYATQLLQENVDKTSWNYGNVVYDGNQLLGLADLKLGNAEAAKRDLLAAGATPGSPLLDIFGPDMPLAKALFAKGEHDVVVTFLDEIGKFWATVPPRFKDNKQFIEVAAWNAHKIQAWKDQIKAGKTPDLNRFNPDPAAAAPPPLLSDGTSAPDFTVLGRDGKPLHLSDYRGKTVVLDFWATWCGPCQLSLPHTNSVAKQFASKNVVVLAVNVWDTQKAFDAWLPKHPEYGALTFAIDPTKDQGKEIATRLFHVSGIPTQYVIDGSGKIVKSFVGYEGPTDDLAKAITDGK